MKKKPEMKIQKKASGGSVGGAVDGVGLRKAIAMGKAVSGKKKGGRV